MSSNSRTDEHEPVYFWREFEQPFGMFSQWYESAFEVDGVRYQSAEMWMMVHKAKLFGDENIARQMTQTSSPAEHQKLGRQAKGFDRKKWDEHKSRIVEEGNYHKFTKCGESKVMSRMLLETGERELVEASPTDRIWGVGFGADNAGKNREHWGENLLGKALMKVREQLKRHSDLS